MNYKNIKNPEKISYYYKRVLYNRACRQTCLHMLDQFVSTGSYYDTGTDVKIDGSQVYGSFWWPIVRDAVLERDRSRCQMCGSTDRLEVHHIMLRHCGGADHPYNLVVLCAACHDRIHHNQITEQAKFEKNQTDLLAYGIDLGKQKGGPEC